MHNYTPSAAKVTVDDLPDAPVDSPSIGGHGSYRDWCEAERARIAAHGIRAIVMRDRGRLTICVAVLRAKGGAK